MQSGCGFSPAFDNIFTTHTYIYIYTYIGNVGEDGGFPSHVGVLLSPISRHHNTYV